MASEPPIPGINFNAEPLPLNGNGNHTHLIAQFAEEVGYLRGVLDALDFATDEGSEGVASEIVSHALSRHNELVTRRVSSMLEGGR